MLQLIYASVLETMGQLRNLYTFNLESIICDVHWISLDVGAAVMKKQFTAMEKKKYK